MLAILMLTQTWFFVGGRELEALCSRDPPRCAAYLEGVADTYEGYANDASPASGICKPYQVTSAQFRQIVLRYIRSHPEARSHAAPRVVVEALRGAYPCPE